MEAALHWISTNANSVQTSIIICTDSQSLCEALSSYNPRTNSIQQCISSISSSIFIQRVPGYSNMPNNELADRATKEAATIESDTIHSIPISCTFQVINDLFCEDPPSHTRTNEIYQHRKTRTDQQQQNRRDDVLTARLRSGHHLSLKVHYHWIDPEIDPTCPSCKQAEHTLEHRFIECPAGDAIRRRVFGNHQGSLKWLATRRGDVIAFARKALVGLARKHTHTHTHTNTRLCSMYCYERNNLHAQRLSK